MSELQEIFKDQHLGTYVNVDLPGTKNTIVFKLQEGPIKEVGENGCQLDSLIGAAATILRSFNSRFPCRENSIAITHLDEAMMWLQKRTKDREKRGVEGTDQKYKFPARGFRTSFLKCPVGFATGGV